MSNKVFGTILKQIWTIESETKQREKRQNRRERKLGKEVGWEWKNECVYKIHKCYSYWEQNGWKMTNRWWRNMKKCCLNGKTAIFKMCPFMMESNDFTGFSMQSDEIALWLVIGKEKVKKEQEMRDYPETREKTCKLRFFWCILMNSRAGGAFLPPMSISI